MIFYLYLLIILLISLFFNKNEYFSNYVYGYIPYYNPFYYFYFPRYCRNCYNKSLYDCKNCVNCGFSINESGFAQCIPGGPKGPFFQADTVQWIY